MPPKDTDCTHALVKSIPERVVLRNYSGEHKGEISAKDLIVHKSCACGKDSEIAFIKRKKT